MEKDSLKDMSSLNKNSTRFTAFVVLGLALATLLTHTAVVFCLHADGTFGFKMADLSASAGTLLQAAEGCMDIPLTFGHTFDETSSLHSILLSFSNFYTFLVAFLSLSLFLFSGFPVEQFTTFCKRQFSSPKTPSECELTHTVLLL
jgi:hypothetical protein